MALYALLTGIHRILILTTLEGNSLNGKAHQTLFSADQNKRTHILKISLAAAQNMTAS